MQIEFEYENVENIKNLLYVVMLYHFEIFYETYMLSFENFSMNTIINDIFKKIKQIT